MSIVDIKNVTYEYFRRDEEGNVEGITTAVDGVTLDVKKGEFVAILGHNGSGKSTLAKHINAILYPAEGNVIVDGMDTKDAKKTLQIRQTAGMVFQNPDNQIIGQVVEEDVGFGPENMGVPTKEIWERVEESLKTVGMYEYREYSPNKLSGGQKQRVSIASVIAMHPKCIIFDEPTAMLDPAGRREVIRAARALNDVEEITVILITHYMEEVIHADRVFVMDHGKIAMQGTPKEIFSRVEELKALRLTVPQVTELAWELKKKGLSLPDGILTRKECVEEIRKCIEGGKAGEERLDFGDVIPWDEVIGKTGEAKDAKDAEALIKPDKADPSDCEKSGDDNSEKRSPADYRLIADHLTYEYNSGTNQVVRALDDVSLTLKPGEFIGLIGHTGSGKSTLVQHLNALLKPTQGTIYYDGADIHEKQYDRKALRGKVGLVFQYPEHQLFEETVFAEVCYGPKNFGWDRKQTELSAYAAIKKVGLPDECFDQSPFDLSGGQKRRVAIASVLVLKPEILILDEPTAGLDPKGRDEILSMIRNLREQENMTIVLVSHSMEDVAEYVDRIIVMDKGHVLYDDSPKAVFSHANELEAIGLAAPEMTYVCRDLKEAGLKIDTTATTVAETVDEIIAELSGDYLRG